MRRLVLMVCAVLLIGGAAAASPVPTSVTTSSRWGCAGIDLVGAVCINNPFESIPGLPGL